MSAPRPGADSADSADSGTVGKAGGRTVGKTGSKTGIDVGSKAGTQANREGGVSVDGRPGRVTALDWVSLALICGCSVLFAVFEIMLIGQFYVGSVIVPLVVLLAVAVNVALPWWGFRTVRAARGAVLPVLLWLLTVLATSIYAPPEGDLLVIAAYGQQWGFYGILLLGTIAGFVTVMRLGNGAARVRERAAADAAPGRGARAANAASAASAASAANGVAPAPADADGYRTVTDRTVADRRGTDRPGTDRSVPDRSVPDPSVPNRSAGRRAPAKPRRAPKRKR